MYNDNSFPFFSEYIYVQVFLYILISYVIMKLVMKGGSHGQNFDWQWE